MFVEIAIAAALQTAASPTTSQEVATAMVNCAGNNNLRLEPSGEAAPVIVNAALASCRSEWAAVRVANIAEAVGRGTNPEIAALATDHAMVEFERMLREQMTSIILNTRAARNR